MIWLHGGGVKMVCEALSSWMMYSSLVRGAQNRSTGRVCRAPCMRCQCLGRKALQCSPNLKSYCMWDKVFMSTHAPTQSDFVFLIFL